MEMDGSDDDIQIINFEKAKKPPTKTKNISSLKKKHTAWVSSSFGGFSDIAVVASSTPQSKQKLPKQTQSDVKRFKRDDEKVSKKSLSALSSQKEFNNQQTLFDNHSSSDTFATLSSNNTADVWVEKYSPVLRDDLAVHKKKIDELSEWLVRAQSITQKHAAPILLMTGPPGSGKTACLKVLCGESGLKIREWEGIAEGEAWTEKSKFVPQYEERSSVDTYTSQSQSSQFHNFLLRANKYNALNIICSVRKSEDTKIDTESNNKSIILVEDLPNVFFRDHSQFHDILQKYRYSGHCPIVFILTDSNKGSSTHKLFPKDLMNKLRVFNINFNPVAPTLLLKLLNKVINQEAKDKKGSFSLNNSIVEQISCGSHGDIRAALNSLQFICRTNCADIKQALASCQSKSSAKGPKSKQKSKSSDSGPVFSPIGAKDSSIFLFHAVGKILYFKRGLPPGDIEPGLPLHLTAHDRDPLLVNPEEVASGCPVSGEMLVSFLHGNYVDFLNSFYDLESASEYFSDGDYLSSIWTAKEELQKYSVSITTRGFIHSNTGMVRHTDVRKNMGWKPLHKSQWFTTTKEAADNVLTARQMFRCQHWEPTVLCCEILPYLKLTNCTLHDAGQISFVQNMNHFSRDLRLNLNRLDEKDTLSENDDEPEASRNMCKKSSLPNATDQSNENDSGLPNSQATVKTSQEEEELLIEEYDD